MTINYAQIFCSVAELVVDMQTPGADEAGLFQRVREASDYLQKEFGWFIPVTTTRTLNGRGNQRLFVPPLLSITSITLYDGTVLNSADYIALPEGGFWTNGPYSRLMIAPLSSHLDVWPNREDGVQIAGLWGLYNLTRSTGAKVKDSPKQTSSQATLTVDNGANVSSGMVALIGSEQELITSWENPVDSTADLNGGITATDAEITLTDASKVNIGEILRVGFEQMKVLDRNTTTQKLYVKRSWNGTQAAAHLTAADVYVYRTVKVERGMNGTAAAEHLTDVDISRYVVPDDILFLVKENATLMLNKAGSQYQGRTGKDDGVIFYNDAFSKPDIDRLKRIYRIPRIG